MPHRGDLILIGGGGHALVVAEAALRAGLTLAGFLDDSPASALSQGEPHAARLGAMDRFDLIGPRAWIIGVGDLSLRERLISAAGLLPGLPPAAAVVHPDAVVSPTARLGAGVFVGPGAVVHTRAVVGDHAIINTGAIIEHECHVGANTHIAPGAILGGRVRVGPHSLIGMGCRVLPNLSIGQRGVVGAGSVVLHSVDEGSVVAGVPASPLDG
ncbi:MAG: NeuD/PglB/VioB family sugar acetyltransferase [Phycisphaeraceae bacterium]|nr:NeuD/PglB/VioB family sugar acetyltransferase [Phycisphaeraceae bacterium]